MLFVDGENLTIRGQKIAETSGITLIEGHEYKRDTYVWFPGFDGLRKLGNSLPDLEYSPIRSSYYTSLKGSHDGINEVRDALRALKFSPYVFKKEREEVKAKGVDIALTKDMLSHAFLNNYQTAVLMAGDGDYIPLI